MSWAESSDVEMESTQDTYPYYVDSGSDVDVADFSEELQALKLESPVLPDVHDLREAAHLCVKDYNSEEGKNWGFVKIIKADRMRACGGYIYLLTLAVKNDQGEQSQIAKMVWQGALFEGITAHENMITPEIQQATVNLEQAYELGFAAAVFHGRYGNGCRPLTPKRVIEFKQIADSEQRHIKEGEGYIDFSNYSVSVVARDWRHNDNEIIINGLLRRSKWILPLNKEMTLSLLQWRQTVHDLDDPPLISSFARERKEPETLPDPEYLHDLDLTSPQIVTQAWFAVENHNFKENTNLKFVKVDRAAVGINSAKSYKLFITAMDGPSPKTFKTEVSEKKYPSLWRCKSPLVPHKEQLGEMMQVDMPRY